MADLIEAWGTLDDAWRAAFELAWEAFKAGSPPIGAVVVDAEGHIVSTGRSRRCEAVAPPGQLAGTSLAHAELNALAQLPPGDYPDHVLSTTLEPCLFCTSAITHSHVGTVRYAAVDSLWTGLRRLPDLNDHIKRRWPNWDGPMSGPFAALSSLLVTIWHLEHRPEHAVLAGHATASPDLLAAAHSARAVAGTLKTSSLSESLRVWSPYAAHAR